MREVVQGNERLHAPFNTGSKDRFISVERSGVDLTWFGFDARPLDPQPENVTPHRRGSVEVLLVALPEPDGATRWFNEPGALPPDPVVRRFSMAVDSALDLKCCGCNTEPESVRKHLLALATAEPGGVHPTSIARRGSRQRR